MVRNEAFRSRRQRVDLRIRPVQVDLENTRVSPQETLRLLESEHRCLIQQQDQLLNEIAESDTTDHYLLTVVNRLRSVEREIEKVRAACN